MDAVPAVCPICGATPSARSIRREDHVATEDYRDQDGHIWTTKWLVPA